MREAFDHRRRAHAARQGQGNRVPARNPSARTSRPGAQRACSARRLRHRRMSTTSWWETAPGTATTGSASVASPCSRPAGRSRHRDSPSTGSAVRASRPSRSPRWASAPGFQDLVVAGGVESMSRSAPFSGPPDFTAGNELLRERYPLVPQGISADLIATLEGFSREDVDAFRSHEPGAGGPRSGRRTLRPQRRAGASRRTALSHWTTTSTSAPARHSKRSRR